MALQYSPKWNQVVSCSQGSTIRLWDADTRICARTLTDHNGCVNKILYSPQEDQLVSCGYDKTVRLWDVESWACLHTFAGHTYTVDDVAFSPQGDQIATASADKTSGSGIRTQGSGDQVASADMDKTVILWDVEAGVCQHTPTDGTVRLWDTKTGVCHYILIGDQGKVNHVVYSQRGDQVASAGCRDKSVWLWDTASSGECRHTLVGHSIDIYAVAYSPRGDLLASWSDTGKGRLQDVETGDCCWHLPYDGSTQSGGILPVNPFVWMSLAVDAFIAGRGDGSVMVWDVVKEGDNIMSTCAGDRPMVSLLWRCMDQPKRQTLDQIPIYVQTSTDDASWEANITTLGNYRPFDILDLLQESAGYMDDTDPKAGAGACHAGTSGYSLS
ncbi:MAG: WD40-repeat-containing domain protein [Benniella sp.]|nr:MAG: WD40-repeat-containing domain protein [Benniella sp.]KAK3811266.1 MAG: WD40-repeat-containing domain protein [Benniella sp.]